MADQQSPIPDEAPYAPPASGNDPDSLKRALKGQLAAATTAGDTGGAEDAQGKLDKLEADQARAEKKTIAAAARREAAEADGGDATTKAPVARTTAAKATTAKVDKAS